jgi:hypothetical protein
MFIRVARIGKSMTVTPARWIKYLGAVVLGNAVYFSLAPHLPPAARHKPFQIDLGVLIDFWSCLFVYGLIELAASLRRRRKG